MKKQNLMNQPTKSSIYSFALVVLFTVAQIKTSAAPILPNGFKPQQNNNIVFTENKGQVHDQNFNARPDVLFGATDGQMIFHLKNNGVSYQLNRIDSWKEIEDILTKEKHNEIDKSTNYRYTEVKNQFKGLFETNVDLSKQAKGIYLLQITSGSETLNRKISIN